MNSAFNLRLILRLMGSLVLIESIVLLTICLIPLIYGEDDAQYFLISSGICLIFGGLGLFLGRNAVLTIGKREGSVIVTFTWIIFTLFGLLPFWLSGSIPSFTDAFFETMSGFTTTGASILDNIEELSHGMLFWRSFTHWMGGLGIIVISLALLPVFGVSGTQLFAAESTGPTKDKIHPRISEIAKRLFIIYIVLTLTQTVLLRLGSMNWFDSLCHSFGTIATGGFSTKQTSIGHWDSAYIEYITIFFMLFSGVNFSLYYFFIQKKFTKVYKNEELRYYLLIILVVSIIIGLSLIDYSQALSWHSIEKSLRTSLFTVTSMMTTTGFAIEDYTLWHPFTWVLILFIMLIGSSAGSTAGGIKVVRIILVFRYCYYEFKRMIHPSAVFPVRYNEHIVKDEVVTRLLAFILLYFILIALGSLVLSFSGLGFEESISGMITCLSDVGPGLGKLGPTYSFSAIPAFSKWFLAIVMLIGRLELFTVLLIFTPVFWKR